MADSAGYRMMLRAEANAARAVGDTEKADAYETQLKKIKEAGTDLSPELLDRQTRNNEVQNMGFGEQAVEGAKYALDSTGVASAQLANELLSLAGLTGPIDSPFVPSIASDMGGVLQDEIVQMEQDAEPIMNTGGGMVGYGGALLAPWLLGPGKYVSGARTLMGSAGRAAPFGAAEFAITQPVGPGQDFWPTKGMQAGTGGLLGAGGELITAPLAMLGRTSRRGESGDLFDETPTGRAEADAEADVTADGYADTAGMGEASTGSRVETEFEVGGMDIDFDAAERQILDDIFRAGIDISDATPEGIKRVTELIRRGIKVTPAEIEYVASGGKRSQRMVAQEAGRRGQAGREIQEELSRLDALRTENIEQLLDDPRFGGADFDQAAAGISSPLLAVLRRRQDSERRAWRVIDENADKPIFTAANKNMILADVSNTIDSELIEIGNPMALQLRDFIDVRMNDSDWTLGDVSKFRTGLNRIYGSTSDPADQRLVREMIRSYDEMLDKFAGVDAGRVTPGDPRGLSPEALDILRNATGASRRLNQLRNGSTRTTDRRNRQTVLSRVISELDPESGNKAPEAVMNRLLSGNGSDAITFLREVDDVLGPQAADRFRRQLRDAALRKAIQSKVLATGENISLRTPGGIKALGDSILTFFSQNKTLARELFTEQDIETLTTLGHAFRDLTPKQNMANWSNTSGGMYGIIKSIADKIPGVKYTSILQNYAESQSEAAARSQIGLSGRASAESGIFTGGEAATVELSEEAIDWLAAFAESMERASRVGSGGKAAGAVGGGALFEGTDDG